MSGLRWRFLLVFNRFALTPETIGLLAWSQRGDSALLRNG
jgi:hypothetical protein